LTKLNEWQVKALELKALGYSSRAICKEFGWSKTKKSTINYFFQRYNSTQSDVVKSKLGNLQVNFDTVLDSMTKDILFFDIETTLAKSYHFQQWQVNLGMKQKIQESHFLSNAWVWGNDTVIHGTILTPEQVLTQDFESLVHEAWALLDNASVVVAHNGKRFDVKKLNAYFLYFGLPPPSPYKVIDTLQIAKSKFNLPFKSLDYLAQYLGVGRKNKTDIDLWIACDKGVQSALDEMMEYNKQDVVVLRDVYKRLLTWDNCGVNMSLYADRDGVTASCTHCGSADIQPLENKLVSTVQRKYNVYRCNNCKTILRGNIKQGNINTLSRVIN
jgi:DNA polymerase III epsilon subunit-like protein